MSKRTDDGFAAQVAIHAGVSLEEAARAATAVVRRIGAWLDDGARQRVAGELPPALAAAIVEPSETGSMPLEESLLERGMTVGEVHELIVTVCGALADELTADTRARIAPALPPSVARMLVPPSPTADRAHLIARGATLADGVPGSRRPLAASAPLPAQSGSITAANPHGDAKLSSARGETQERDGTTLAAGHPGTDRPLAPRDAPRRG